QATEARLNNQYEWSCFDSVIVSFFERCQAMGRVRAPRPVIAFGVAREVVYASGIGRKRGQALSLARRISLQATSFNYQRGELVLRDDVFEVTHKTSNRLFVATNRSELFAMLIGEYVIERVGQGIFQDRGFRVGTEERRFHSNLWQRGVNSFQWPKPRRFLHCWSTLRGAVDNTFADVKNSQLVGNSYS